MTFSVFASAILFLTWGALAAPTQPQLSRRGIAIPSGYSPTFCSKTFSPSFHVGFHPSSFQCVIATGTSWKGENMKYLVEGRPMVVLTGAQIGDEKAWTAVTRMPNYVDFECGSGREFSE
ncbi:glycoside hydrolase family 16 protein [Neurospora crassa]|nr:glycoside hydrolase family 16 protein [Neurospora crassa]